MYIQITTKCNMTCEHCCYSCNKNGKHGDYSTMIDSIAFARETMTIISLSVAANLHYILDFSIFLKTA